MSDIGIHNTQGDVIGVGVSGTGNIVGRDVTVHQKVVHIYAGSPEAVEALHRIGAIPTEVRPTGQGGSASAPDASVQRQLDEVLQVVKELQARGVETSEVEMGGVHVSHVDLLLKKAVLLKGEADQVLLDAVAKHAPAIRRQMDAGGGRAEVDFGPVMAGTEEPYLAKLTEARDVLREVIRIDPYNTEALLHLAQVSSALEDNAEADRLVMKVVRLLETPRDDTERFRRAQALLMMAKGEEMIHPDLVRDARAQFAQLGRTEWVRHADELLADIEGGAGGGWHGGAMHSAAPSGPWQPDAVSHGGFPGAYAAADAWPGFGAPAAAPAGGGFQPAGRWHVEIGDMLGSTMELDLRSGGAMQGTQSMGMLGMSLPFAGGWSWTPSVLSLQGLISGFQPFALQIQVTGRDAAGFDGQGMDGMSYRFTRA